MTIGKWKILFLLCWLVPFAKAAEPAGAVWLVNPQANQNPNLARVQPEVHSITLSERFVEVRSAGISLYDFGVFQTPANPVERLRQFLFRIPRRPEAATKAFAGVRSDAVGVFVNGVPIYNHFEAASYLGQNLWHFDAIAQADDGTWTASGRTKLEHTFAPGLFEKLIADAGGHSPIIGYAFDGFPIYGPWGFANADGTGGVRRLRSSYRLRQLKRRTNWPDGTALTPAQFGPEVNTEFPLGSFVEDYEFAAGAGDLDEFNGRFAKTPEYPEGTYAYVLSTDAQGRLAFPYLLARQYRGQISAEDLNTAFADLAAETSAPIACQELALLKRDGAVTLELKVVGKELAAGEVLRLSFQARKTGDTPIRFLEYVHERPLHLIVVSEDLAEFDHIHPELATGDRYEVAHTFQHAGRYRLYADFTPPGAAQRIEVFDLNIGGKPRQSMPLVADAELTKQSAGLRFTLSSKQPPRAGEDIEFTIAVSDAATGKAVNDLEPYLGAWAHFVLIDQPRQSFIHAHPLETAAASASALPHTHTVQAAGPSPAEIRFLASFPQPGLYKLWAQFQRNGQVLIQSFVLQIGAAQMRSQTVAVIPPDAVKVAVSAGGFQPAQISVPAGKPFKLAVTRDHQPNCGNRIVFPALSLARDLPLGETVLVELPTQPAGELRFTCGMGMYKGSIVVN
ncbi:MAG TPA: YHYH protein [Blastocatellia bacterium]|nr:YHYH protein [Blastocatellia bacterium]HMX26814.1 YHYH protein [Blastocatellia bacterium]HMY71075.1 YHYH protein [Blastocatellia bacterium]HMZ17677.1 YHYH protein [Blastocatellia bacterium]HNG32697.1 YHYH protein [Blastocatellia bacterium]